MPRSRKWYRRPTSEEWKNTGRILPPDEFLLETSQPIRGSGESSKREREREKLGQAGKEYCGEVGSASDDGKRKAAPNTTSNECSDQISAESDGLIASYGIADRDPKRGDINFLSIGPLASFAIAISPPFLPRSTTLGARSDPPMLAFHLKRYWMATD
ncbi:hypothetical protein C8R44DRAFT_856168 [Mycena epipterygia]|nr:hypothetical protein C8R44DRAFT_856168 [Mycena epipterygia]